MQAVCSILDKKKWKEVPAYDRAAPAGHHTGAEAKGQRLAVSAMPGLYAKTKRTPRAGGVLVLPVRGFPPDRAGGTGGRHLLLAGGAAGVGMAVKDFYGEPAPHSFRGTRKLM